MTSPLYVTATDLKLWANQRVAQSEMPRLVRSLILATIHSPERIDFPADESVQSGGWDGILQTVDHNTYVPQGLSGWEFGVTSDVSGKADKDYKKRVENPLGLIPEETTFVFVTPRIWSKKEEWAEEKNAEGVWKEVRTYDANDLEQWLSLAPAVHIWFSQLVGKTPNNMTDFETFWKEWIHQTSPAITPELVLAGRSEAAEQLESWVRGDASAQALQGESREEALAVFLAMLYQLPEEERNLYLARGAIVYDPVAWRSLTRKNEPLLLVPYFDAVEGSGFAVEQGHHVFVPQDRVTSLRSGVLEIPRLNRDTAQKALEGMGVSEIQSRADALIARRSLLVLRRKLARGATFERPAWAKPEYARQIIPAMLIGEWTDTNEEDQKILEQLSGSSYQSLVTHFTRWKEEADAPLRRIGSVWLITSRQDSWELLLSSLIPEDLKRYEEQLLHTLGTVDPRESMEFAERLLLDLSDAPKPASELLRQGMVDTLALMASLNDTFIDGSTGQEWATKIVRKLLQKTKTEPLLWLSLASFLPLIAEAAPEVFLEAIEQNLDLATSELRPMLTKSMEADPLLEKRLHVPLLWALEGLAWNPSYLRAVSRILAKLILLDLDEKNKSGNRPEGSLRDIFLLWSPQTSATLEQRLKVLDVLRQQEPSIAWKLMLEILPEAQGSIMNSSRPKWREWAQERKNPLTYSELWRANSAISERLLQDAGQEGSRWCNLLERLPDLPEEEAQQFVQNLLEVKPAFFTSSDQVLLWQSCGKFISHHRDFETSDWALPAERINHLEQAYHRLTPEDRSIEYANFFASTPYLLQSFGGDWQAKERAIAQKGLEAVQALYARGQLDELLKFVLIIELPGQCGYIVGKNELLTEAEIESVCEGLSLEPSTATSQFSHSLIRGLVEKRGDAWIEDIRARPSSLSWSATHRADFYLCLNFSEQTWQRVNLETEDVKKLYWAKAGGGGFDLTEAALEEAIKNLLLAGRPYEVVFLLGQYRHNHGQIRSALVEQTLQMVLQTPPPNALHVSRFSHNVADLINDLEAAGEIDSSALARLEWSFLPFLKYHRPTKTLHQRMSKEPAFFLEVISFLYASSQEEKTSPPTPEDKLRAHRAYELLEAWQWLPGLQEDGTIDFPDLNSWAEEVRKLATEKGLLSSVDSRIGHLLAHSPRGSDGFWPVPAIRELLEIIRSEEVSQGFMIQTFNNRGVVSKLRLEGGKQERALAQKYQEDATAILDQYPYTASLLSQIADNYERKAREADLQSELEEDLH